MTTRIEEIDDTPSAFEIKICEMTSAVFHRDKSPYQANKVLFKGHAKALTQAYQAGDKDGYERGRKAGIDEAVEIIKGMKRNQDAPKENDPHFTGCGGCGEAYPAICGCREVNQALDDTLTIINSIFKE